MDVGTGWFTILGYTFILYISLGSLGTWKSKAFLWVIYIAIIISTLWAMYSGVQLDYGSDNIQPMCGEYWCK